jgi:hypothetical protein
MIKRTVICAVTALIPLASVADSANVKWPDCFCTDSSGTRVELGETVCLSVDGRTYQARCEMMLNNPMWREIGSSCAVSLKNGQPSGPNTDIPLVQTANG